MYSRELNGINCCAINNATYLQGKTGSGSKWVTRFQLPGALCWATAVHVRCQRLQILPTKYLIINGYVNFWIMISHMINTYH